MAGKLIYNLKRKRCEHSPSTSDSEDYEKPDKFVKLTNDDIHPSTESFVNQEASHDRPLTLANQNFLFEALKKIQELEDELALLDEENVDSGHEDDDGDTDESSNFDLLCAEADAIGFAACAKETLNFLAAEGLSSDNPLVLALRNRLIGKCPN